MCKSHCLTALTNNLWSSESKPSSMCAFHNNDYNITGD